MFFFLLNEFCLQHHYPLNESLFIEGFSGIDYGSAMAYSYFYGYLKLVLSNYGDDGKSFNDLIAIYEGTHQVNNEQTHSKRA